MRRSTAKTDRLEARIPSDVKATLVRAASLRDQAAFAEALLNPPDPSPALVRAAQRYRSDPH